MKEAPLTADRVLLPLLNICAFAFLLCLEVTKAVLWAQQNRQQLPPPPLLRQMVSRTLMRTLSLVAASCVYFGTTTPAADGAGDELAWLLLSVILSA